MRITELTEQEKLYASKQSQQIRGQTGAVECSFVVFDNNCLYLSGEKYSTYYDREAFADNYNDTLGQLQKDGFMKSQQEFIRYGSEHYGGVRIDNNGYTYITTFEPENGSAKMHIYDTEKLNSHMKEAERGVKVRCGDEEFIVPDGGKIVVDYHDGSEPTVRTVRYIDPAHFELDASSLGLYHRDEYSMIMQEHGYSVTPFDESQKMTVVFVKPGCEAEICELPNGELETLQKTVGGYIEAFYFDPNGEVAIICNDEGKINGMKPNRAMYDDENNMYDIVYGQFIVVGLGEDDFCSLTPEQAHKYCEQFKAPERFYFFNDRLVAEKEVSSEQHSRGPHI